LEEGNPRIPAVKEITESKGGSVQSKVKGNNLVTYRGKVNRGAQANKAKPKSEKKKKKKA